jgi:hypothetical protein
VFPGKEGLAESALAGEQAEKCSISKKKVIISGKILFLFMIFLSLASVTPFKSNLFYSYSNYHYKIKTDG